MATKLERRLIDRRSGKRMDSQPRCRVQRLDDAAKRPVDRISMVARYTLPDEWKTQVHSSHLRPPDPLRVDR